MVEPAVSLHACVYLAIIIIMPIYFPDLYIYIQVAAKLRVLRRLREMTKLMVEPAVSLHACVYLAIIIIMPIYFPDLYIYR